MKNIYKIFKVKNVFHLLAFILFSVTSLTINTTCIYSLHQPKLPESAKKLRKF